MNKEHFDQKDLFLIFDKLKKNNCFDAQARVIHRIEKYFLSEFIEEDSFKTSELLEVIISFFSKDFDTENYIANITKCLTTDELNLLVVSVWIYEESELKKRFKMIEN